MSTMIWITPKWPFPVDDGARQATTQLLKHVAKSGKKIHLCSIVPTSELSKVDAEQAKRELGVEKVTIVERVPATKAKHLLNFFKNPFMPVTLSPYSTSSIRKQIEAIVSQEKNPTVVFDGLHAAGCISRSEVFSDKSIQTIYRAHNMERDLWIRGAEAKKNPVFSAFLRYQAVLVEKFEKEVSERSKVVFPVSEVDEALFNELVPGTKVVSLPIGISVDGFDPKFSTIERSTDEILFVGRLDWPPNRDGLQWILDNVWQKAVAKNPKLRLKVVGSGDGSWLKNYPASENFQFLGRVDSVAKYYNECAASLVPVFFGSGTRVKAIEASLFHRVCISSDVGVEGIGLVAGKSFYKAEKNVDEWIDVLANFKSKEALEMGAMAYEHARQKFDPAEIAKKFLANLN